MFGDYNSQRQKMIKFEYQDIKNDDCTNTYLITFCKFEVPFFETFEFNLKGN